MSYFVEVHTEGTGQDPCNIPLSSNFTGPDRAGSLQCSIQVWCFTGEEQILKLGTAATEKKITLVKFSKLIIKSIPPHPKDFYRRKYKLKLFADYKEYFLVNRHAIGWVILSLVFEVKGCGFESHSGLGNSLRWFSPSVQIRTAKNSLLEQSFGWDWKPRSV